MHPRGIKGVRGHWIKVEANQQSGFAFDGYLSPIAPRLFYISTSAQGGFDWMTYNPYTEESRMLLHTEKRPDHIMWDLRRAEIIFSDGENVFAARGKEQPVKIAALGDKGARLLWIEKRTGRLRRVYLEETDKLNRPTSTNTEKVQVTFKGKIYTVKRFWLNEDRTSYLAVCEEWDGKQWRIVEVRSTEIGCALPGADVFRPEYPRYIAVLPEVDTFLGEDHSTSVPDVSRLNQIYKPSDRQGYWVVPLSGGNALVYGWSSGDAGTYPHAPLLFCKSSCNNSVEIVSNGGLLLSSRGPFIFIQVFEDGMDGMDRILLIHEKSPNPIWREEGAMRSAWMSFDWDQVYEKSQPKMQLQHH